MTNKYHIVWNDMNEIKSFVWNISSLLFLLISISSTIRQKHLHSVDVNEIHTLNLHSSECFSAKSAMFQLYIKMT